MAIANPVVLVMRSGATALVLFVSAAAPSAAVLLELVPSLVGHISGLVVATRLARRS